MLQSPNSKYRWRMCPTATGTVAVVSTLWSFFSSHRLVEGGRVSWSHARHVCMSLDTMKRLIQVVMDFMFSSTLVSICL
uniref:Uncharacterized protein n=1 Tax=Aegilops tauschii subsp. strangulata TaxID=200361 RepID=A0A452ZX94_AEGTS